MQREFASGLLDWLQLSGKKPGKPSELLRTTALINRIGNFFGGSQLCQVTDETNPIAELTHKRRVTSLGPGGLNRRSAGVDPRDVASHALREALSDGDARRTEHRTAADTYDRRGSRRTGVAYRTRSSCARQHIKPLARHRQKGTYGSGRAER